MADPSEELLAAMTTLERLAGALTPEEAAEQIDQATLQAFWREWPATSSWSGALWRVLNLDLAAPASQQKDPEIDETGGSG